MSLWSRVQSVLLAFVRRTDLERNMDAELRFHIESYTDDLVRSGVPRQEAARRTRIEFGSVESSKEECRQARGLRWLDEFRADLRYTFRTLRASPGFTAVAALSLALGIGANTAIFSLVDAVLLRLLPVQEPGRLFFLENVGWRGGGGAPPYPCFEQFRDHNRYFTGMAAFAVDDMQPAINGQREPIIGQYISGNYFSLLGVPALLGRTLTPADDSVAGKGGRPDGPVAVISYRYWKRRFAMSPSVLGRVIQVGDTAFTIVGVTPPEFFGLQVGVHVDLSVPMIVQDPDTLRDRASWWFSAVGRLRPGVSAEPAQSELNAIFQSFISDNKTLPADIRKDYRDHIQLEPAGKGLDKLRREFSTPLLTLMAIVGLVLLIACANVSNLLLARATARRQEFATRLALGASRGRLIRQMLTESLALVGLGALLGLVFARLGGDLLVSFFTSGRNQILLDLSLDPRVLAFTTAVSLATGLLFGLAPALRATQDRPGPGLNGSRSSTSSTQAGKLLVVLQVALSLVLLAGAALFVRSLRNLSDQDSGFRSDGVLTLTVDPNPTLYKGTRRATLWTEILNRMSAIPGVESASLSSMSPLSGRDSGVWIEVPGFPSRSWNDVQVVFNRISPGYLDTLGIPLLRGRTFTDMDRRDAPRVAMLSDTTARFYFGERSPLGTKVRFDYGGGEKISFEIVGVVKDTKHDSMRYGPPRLVYFPIPQALDQSGSLILELRSSGDPLNLASAIRPEIRAAGSDILIKDIRTLAQQVDQSLIQERLVSELSSFFGLLALLLACIGLYGIMSYAVVRRTGEIGIRIALGAQRGRVIWLILRETLALIASGVVIGIPATLASARYVESQLFGLKPTDPVTIGLATVTLLLVAMLAGYLPARRASRLDPMAALRHE